MGIDQYPGPVETELQDLKIIALVNDAKFISTDAWPTAYQCRDACFTAYICGASRGNDCLVREWWFGPVAAIQVDRAAINPATASGRDFDHKPCVRAVLSDNPILTAVIDQCERV